ncbi:peroxiredoxin family protein, partial [Kaarinaea lacus]
MKAHKVLKSYWLIAAAVLSLWSISSAAGQGLKDFDGKPSAIENYAGKGKWLVVMLWASDCHVCNQEVHQYKTFQEKHADKDAMIL